MWMFGVEQSPKEESVDIVNVGDIHNSVTSTASASLTLPAFVWQHTTIVVYWHYHCHLNFAVFCLSGFQIECCRLLWLWYSIDKLLMFLHKSILCQSRNNTHTHTTVLWLYGFCLRQPGWVSTRRNIHPLTSVLDINHPLSASSIYYNPWHSVCSIYVPDSFFSPISKFPLVYLGLAPSTSYSTHFFTQSLSSFSSTCPYHRNLFCCTTKIMSSNPSLSTLYLELYLAFSYLSLQ